MLKPANKRCDTLVTVFIFRMLRFWDWCTCARVSSSDLLPSPLQWVMFYWAFVCLPLSAFTQKNYTDRISMTITGIPKTYLSTRTTTMSFKQRSQPHLNHDLRIFFHGCFIIARCVLCSIYNFAHISGKTDRIFT